MCERLRLENISKVYQDDNGETVAIKDFSYVFKKGHFVSIIGPSGCGKSTLLSIIGGLEAQTSGTIFLDNSILTRSNNNIGYMLQRDYLLSYRTVFENVLLGVQIKRMRNRATYEYANELLDKYGLGEFKNKYKPDMLLLDEAFSALDYQTRLQVTDDVYKIIKAEEKTTIMVTHDIPEAISMSDEVIVLTKRPSTIEAVYKIEFNIPSRTPLTSRDDPKFTKYFDLIWKSLNR